jgi:hypothetical protein
MTWTSFVIVVALSTFAVVCVFEGVRRLCTHDFSKIALVTASFGLLYCVGYVGFNYWTYTVLHTGSVVLRKGVVIPKLPTEWGNFPLTQKAEVSIGIARGIFLERGQLSYHFDELGNKLLFSPNQVDLNQREEKVAQLARLDYMVWVSSVEAGRWLIITITAGIFGFFWSSAKSKNKSDNMTIADNIEHS